MLVGVGRVIYVFEQDPARFPYGRVKDGTIQQTSGRIELNLTESNTYVMTNLTPVLVCKHRRIIPMA